MSNVVLYLGVLGSVVVKYHLHYVLSLCSQRPSLLRRVVDIATTFASDHTATNSVTMVALQLMANVCVGQRSGQEIMWNICFPHMFRYRVQHLPVHTVCMLYCKIIFLSSMFNKSCPALRRVANN